MNFVAVLRPLNTVETKRLLYLCRVSILSFCRDVLNLVFAKNHFPRLLRDLYNIERGLLVGCVCILGTFPDPDVEDCVMFNKGISETAPLIKVYDFIEKCVFSVLYS